MSKQQTSVVLSKSFVHVVDNKVVFLVFFLIRLSKISVWMFVVDSSDLMAV